MGPKLDSITSKIGTLLAGLKQTHKEAVTLIHCISTYFDLHEESIRCMAQWREHRGGGRGRYMLNKHVV